MAAPAAGAVKIVASEAAVERRPVKVPDLEECSLRVWFVWQLDRDIGSLGGSVRGSIQLEGPGMPASAGGGSGPKGLIVLSLPVSPAKSGTWTARLQVGDGVRTLIAPTDAGATLRAAGSCDDTGRTWIPDVPSPLPARDVMRHSGNFLVRATAGGPPACRESEPEAMFRLHADVGKDPTDPTGRLNFEVASETASLTTLRHDAGPASGVLRPDGSFRFERSFGPEYPTKSIVIEGRVVGDRIEYTDTRTLQATSAGSSCAGVVIVMNGSGSRL